MLKGQNDATQGQRSDLTALSVYGLFTQGSYRIPAYQRNYAWGEAEVGQLIQDVMDVARQPESADYYIGTLVVSQRSDGSFETIDGQQRHTTLSILLAVLKTVFERDLGGIDQTNLIFDSRPAADSTLKRLFKPEQPAGERGERAILSAFEIAQRELAAFTPNEREYFTQFLLNKVQIIRVMVPPDTDLNHYFEIMNNRGEQLEKHEVLKARLMETLADEPQRVAFAKIWQACADMHRYVQLNVESRLRSLIFGRDWNTLPRDFSVLCEFFDEGQQSGQALTLAELIASPALVEQGAGSNPDQPGTFSSIITFPNFLLQVLRAASGKNVPLDDKRLLESFDEVIRHRQAPAFIMQLLQARMLFDRYIIKRENDEDWSLKTLKKYDTTPGYINTAQDEGRNKQLTMLVAMFHVSYPAQVYKHWLNAALHYLLGRWQTQGDINEQAYLSFLEDLSQRFFFGRYGKTSGGEPVDYYALIYQQARVPEQLDEAGLSTGTHVQNFVFNRLDYLLWRTLNENGKLAGVDLSAEMSRVRNFTFTFRNSVEHYYPQQPLSGGPLEESTTLPHGVDSFGNLCLISRSDNSRLSNFLPAAKKEHYRHTNAAESLKQLVMMSYSEWGPEAPQQIAAHQQQMIELLCRG